MQLTADSNIPITGSSYALVAEPVPSELVSSLTQGLHQFSISTEVEYQGVQYPVLATLDFELELKLVICDDPAINSIDFATADDSMVKEDYTPGEGAKEISLPELSDTESTLYGLPGFCGELTHDFSVSVLTTDSTKQGCGDYLDYD